MKKKNLKWKRPSTILAVGSVAGNPELSLRKRELRLDDSYNICFRNQTLSLDRQCTPNYNSNH